MKHFNLILLTSLLFTSFAYGLQLDDATYHLDLSGKQIASLNLNEILRSSPNLKTLKAIGCGIVTIVPLATSNNLLKEIDLSDNHLPKWQMSLFAKAGALKNLNLSNNKIREIDLTGAQENLSLNLKNNELLFIELHKIKRGKPLAFLDLSGNNLTELAFEEMISYVPAYEESDRTVSRATNLIIAGIGGTIVTVSGLCYSWYKEQVDRNARGTWGTESEDRRETKTLTYGSFALGAATAIGIYKKLNKTDDTIYALTHQQWVKKIDLRDQKSGARLLRDLEKNKSS